MNRFLVLFVALTSICGAMAAGIPLRPDPESVHDLQLQDLGNGEWEIRTTGADPYFMLRTSGGEIDLKATPTLSFDYFSTTGVGRTPLEEWSTTRAGRLPVPWACCQRV